VIRRKIDEGDAREIDMVALTDKKPRRKRQKGGMGGGRVPTARMWSNAYGSDACKNNVLGRSMHVNYTRGEANSTNLGEGNVDYDSVGGELKDDVHAGGNQVDGEQASETRRQYNQRSISSENEFGGSDNVCNDETGVEGFEEGPTWGAERHCRIDHSHASGIYGQANGLG
jgi:hypothetical protein